MIYVSSIKMSSSGKPNVLLEGEIILNHSLIIKQVQLIQGHHRLFLNFPQVRDQRLIYPLNTDLYEYLLNQVIEYYAHSKSDS
ncbi:hypothetical protein FBR4_0410 [Lactiplantibacillus plantarum]|uniref:hypothetical protein n=1 Tax=Lactiplantibacillus plantarum TaxID=1590 RepID=UPI0007AC0096|nr:hypothetical protein [Lactiplantibacillus plantarum]KZE00953.1 hypothetical protein FBR4_0410 [Lactiplantibacillus plantarum]